MQKTEKNLLLLAVDQLFRIRDCPWYVTGGLKNNRSNHCSAVPSNHISNVAILGSLDRLSTFVLGFGKIAAPLNLRVKKS